ncbi:MAG: hypothetical protein ABI697_08085 [Devosia sp.]
MAEPRFDVAIVGSGPLSLLLAAELVRIHGKRVARIGNVPSLQRLPRQVSICLPLATRPSTWRLVDTGLAEAREVLPGDGSEPLLAATEVLVTADLAASRTGLDHMAHMALGHGLKARARDTGWLFSRVPVLRDQALYEAHGMAGAASAVTYPATDVRLEIADGSATLSAGDTQIDAGLIVLVDDAALIELLPTELWPEPLRLQSITSTLTAPTSPIAAPVVHAFDRGVTLVRRDGNAVLAIIAGDADLETRLGSMFAGPFPIRRMATSRSHRVASLDGAPVVGPLAAGRIFIAAGLGSAAPFFGGPLARAITGTSGDAETAWFTAHAPGSDRTQVAELSTRVLT